jgi:protein-S-isoprenylcysteine O-methyltransferase Ste14
MAYIDQMRRSGGWLFRWRGYLPLFFIGIVLASLTQFRFIGGSELDDEWWEAFCLAVSLFGLVIRALTVGFTPERTSGRNAREQRAAQLNTEGLYSMVRHPLYLGNFFLWMGIALYPHNWLVALLCVGIYWLYYERIMVAEEAFLAAEFGDEFELWSRATPAFIPDFRRYRPASAEFSLRNVLKREYPAFSGTIFAMFILEMAGDYEVLGRFELDTLWIVLLALGIGVHVLLRTLKKHTRLLHVSGR